MIFIQFFIILINHTLIILFQGEDRQMRRCLAFLLITCLSVVTVYGGSFDPVSVGERASAMGGAYIGLANDVSGIYWNPSGLTDINRVQWQFSGRYRNDIYESIPSHTAKEERENSHICLNFAAFAIPFSLFEKKMLFAAGFQRQMELVTYFQNKKTNNLFGTQDYDKDISGGVLTCSPSLGIEIVKGVSIGAGVNFWGGKRTYDVKMFDK